MSSDLFWEIIYHNQSMKLHDLQVYSWVHDECLLLDQRHDDHQIPIILRSDSCVQQVPQILPWLPILVQIVSCLILVHLVIRLTADDEISILYLVQSHQINRLRMDLCSPIKQMVCVWLPVVASYQRLLLHNLNYDNQIYQSKNEFWQVR